MFADLPHRQRLIVRLLETYRDAEDASGSSGEGSLTRDSRPFQMSELWHGGSYPELEQILKQMKIEHPRWFWHVSERFLKAKLMRRAVKFRKRSRAGQQIIEPILGPRQAHAGGAPHIGESVATLQVWEWHPDVNLVTVRRGLKWIDEEFERRYQAARARREPRFSRWQPQLPEEFREHAA